MTSHPSHPQIRPCRATVGDRSFATAACPRVWTGLPGDVASATSLLTFPRNLKAHLFRQPYQYSITWLSLSFTIVDLAVFYLGHYKCIIYNVLYCNLLFKSAVLKPCNRGMMLNVTQSATWDGEIWQAVIISLPFNGLGQQCLCWYPPWPYSAAGPCWEQLSWVHTH